MPHAQLILYGRGYCHLCEDMRAALAAGKWECDFSVTVVDVDADPALVARYDEKVPVLTGLGRDGAAMEICHYFLDESALRAFLGAFSVESAGPSGECAA